MRFLYVKREYEVCIVSYHKFQFVILKFLTWILPWEMFVPLPHPKNFFTGSCVTQKFALFADKFKVGVFIGPETPKALAAKLSFSWQVQLSFNDITPRVSKHRLLPIESQPKIVTVVYCCSFCCYCYHFRFSQNWVSNSWDMFVAVFFLFCCCMLLMMIKV